MTRLDELRAKVDAGLPLLLSEASVVLGGASVDFLWKLIRSGVLQHSRRGRLFQIPANEVRRLEREAGIVRPVPSPITPPLPITPPS